MRCRFILHVDAEVGDVDPYELMSEVEALAQYGGLDNFVNVGHDGCGIECFDAIPLEIEP